LGLKLKRVSNAIYKIDTKTLYDGREEIFAVWQQRDELMLANLKSVAFEIADNLSDWKSGSIQEKPSYAGYIV
jgi:hypothetical protein